MKQRLFIGDVFTLPYVREHLARSAGCHMTRVHLSTGDGYNCIPLYPYSGTQSY